MTARRAAGAALVVAGAWLVVLPLALIWWAGSTTHVADPLTPTERAAVAAQLPAVANLGAALRQVPLAMADARPGATADVLDDHPELAALLAAIRDPASIQEPLRRAFAAAAHAPLRRNLPSGWLLAVLLGPPGLLIATARRPLAAAGALAVVAVLFVPLPGGSLWSGASTDRATAAAATATVETDLALVQAAYGDIVPALRVADPALTDAAATAVIEADRRLAPLQELLGGLSALYGAGVLATQASVAATPGRSARAFGVLPMLALVPAAAALLVVTGEAVRPRSGTKRPTRAA